MPVQKLLPKRRGSVGPWVSPWLGRVTPWMHLACCFSVSSFLKLWDWGALWTLGALADSLMAGRIPGASAGVAACCKPKGYESWG